MSQTERESAIVRKQYYQDVIHTVLAEIGGMTHEDQLATLEHVRYLVGKEHLPPEDTLEIRLAARAREVAPKLTRHELMAAIGSASFVVNQQRQRKNVDNRAFMESLRTKETHEGEVEVSFPADSGNLGMGPDGPLSKPPLAIPRSVPQNPPLPAEAVGSLIDAIAGTLQAQLEKCQRIGEFRDVRIETVRYNDDSCIEAIVEIGRHRKDLIPLTATLHTIDAPINANAKAQAIHRFSEVLGTLRTVPHASEAVSR